MPSKRQGFNGVSVHIEESDGTQKGDCSDMGRVTHHAVEQLAFYNLKSMDKAIDMFRDALEEAGNAPDSGSNFSASSAPERVSASSDFSAASS
jgi:hypothetical protein